MNISEEVTYDKDGEVERFPLFKKLFLSLVIILVATLSFGIGRLSMMGKGEPIKIEYDSSLNTVSNTASAISAVKELPSVPVNASQTVVVSKNGEKYHYLHCSGAKQIKEENKIVFASPSLAESAGYTLAANCKPR
ncbi:MAG: hypothetical protein AAB719_00485 [Patescibacteria group bacterium]